MANTSELETNYIDTGDVYLSDIYDNETYFLSGIYVRSSAVLNAIAFEFTDYECQTLAPTVSPTDAIFATGDDIDGKTNEPLIDPNLLAAVITIVLPICCCFWIGIICRKKIAKKCRKIR